MKEKLTKLLANAYSPYYKFPVSAIVVMKDEKEFCGVNVENANGTSICAERNAIARCVNSRRVISSVYLPLTSSGIIPAESANSI